MAKRYIDAEKLKGLLLLDQSGIKDALKHGTHLHPVRKLEHKAYIDAIEYCVQQINEAPTADVAEVERISEQIIKKKAEVTEYWKNDVQQYRALKGYSDIEHDADNFLRGYNEAVEDMLAILDGARMDGDEE